MSFGFTPHVPANARPMQVKFFRAQSLEELQNSINRWLSENAQREVVDVRQSVFEAASSVLVSVWYVE